MRKRKREEEIEKWMKELCTPKKKFFLKRVKSILAAAMEYNLNYSRLYRRVHGGKSRSKARADQQFLRKAEESELIRWIKQCTIVGYPHFLSNVA